MCLILFAASQLGHKHTHGSLSRRAAEIAFARAAIEISLFDFGSLIHLACCAYVRYDTDDAAYRYGLPMAARMHKHLNTLKSRWLARDVLLSVRLALCWRFKRVLLIKETMKTTKAGLLIVSAMALAVPLASATPLLTSELKSFAVLGAEAVTNVPNSTVVGNVGVSPGSSITGFNSSPGVATGDPQVTSGLVQTLTALAGQAHFGLTVARNDLDLLGSGSLLGADLVNLILFPGVYTVPSAASNLTGKVTLDGQGNANAAWVFQMTGSLITSPGSVVRVINTGSGAGIYWNVRSSATIDTTTEFEGNILALTSITLNNGATLGCGRALANNGAVTMDMNAIGIGCAASTGGVGSDGFSGGLSVTNTTDVQAPTFLPFARVDSVSTVPEPGSLGLIALALAAIGFSRRKLA
jgi:hypothetical protein